MATRFNKISVLLATIALFLGVSGIALAGEYEGSWILNDTDGKPFQATLNQDGTATGTHKDTMKQGTWKEENGAAVIQWNTGWTTRIAKQGDKYVKTAFKPGAPLTATPTNTSEAKKKQ
jgi:carbon monoxide dehydrogenase subunit G